jgi:acetyl esterase/lipase
METRYAEVHPQLQQVARKSPQLHFSSKTLWLINLAVAWMPAPKLPDDIQVENVLIPGREEQTRIRLRIYRPKALATPAPALLWLHGGGYLIGKPEMDDLACAEYAREAGIVVVSVDYRRAPRHPFPAALDDSYAALAWMASYAPRLGVDLARIAAGGRSAGGGLAAALVQLAHDRQEIRPVFQLLIYPMLDDRTVLRADLAGTQHLIWSQKSNRFGWESYLGRECGAAETPPYAVPARRADLSGLPPVWIGVGSLDLFHDENVGYAQRLRACGVACEIEIVPGAFHGFDGFDRQLPIVQDFRKAQVSALKRALFPSS